MVNEYEISVHILCQSTELWPGMCYALIINVELNDINE